DYYCQSFANSFVLF
nr:immunoglobulin light chain junction region [Macaca mulatta]MOX16970.1 immunoglobulin light chain junction region [Macaca mulatta]MOX17016.1 immunoglobulin light chain junction region [Macaca mulatta]MOX17065.1 immunoglobulin light chain junction region [Macaca mulatta]MOX17125.1 immunoglobulin light chain junction region [Macaca mulatta]